ncbi:class A beta-lactamase-related serine hydrolase [Lacihabitans sp. LS3-19]|uniref:serine hydrolase domain-containing protein n=1 Tax=Lacihabitans sp. LS3-19 TaxID=2487335 RepID=UPI0020CEC8F9|nr:serine hydrolase domain-containing protein [Lacihabitans sp. LS3-19]MCP9770611.1 class A beta-lactamase-related serine hydrolase [Lacihabitans sp. LS3-19]
MRKLAVIFFVIENTVLHGQSPKSFTPIQIKLLDSIAAQDVPKGAPGIATGIVSNGKIVYQKVAGFANLTDSSLITKDTRFNIASNGKQFTALAILVLIDEKKISLTDDIRKYLPTIYTKLKSKITIENLLNHTSGIRDVYDLWSLQGLTWWEHSFSNKDVLELIEKQQELNFNPGTKYLYSNTNYILLTAIVEEVTGKSFVEYTNDLFKKLNMPNTSFENNHTKIRGPIAKAYFNFDTWTTYDWIWNVCGDGNIFSTLADQLHWEQILQGKIKSKIKRQILEKSQQLTDNSTIKNYGYGLEFSTYKGLPYKFHEGATGAWKATVIRFPNKNISIVTLTNTGKSTPNTQTRQMADVVFNLKNNASYLVTKPAKVGSFVSEEDMVGTYQTDNNFTFQFERIDSILYLKRIGRNDVKLEREADNILHQTYDPDFKQEFKKNEEDEMTVTVYYTSHSPYTLTKANSNWTKYNYQALNGKFINSETNVTIDIKFSGDKYYDIKVVGSQDSIKGFLISPTKLLVNNYVFDIENNGGTPKTFLLSADRIERVKFVRLD